MLHGHNTICLMDISVRFFILLITFIFYFTTVHYSLPFEGECRITYEDNRERVDYISMYHFRARS